jgi:tryptophanyl-tRNA synthetase
MKKMSKSLGPSSYVALRDNPDIVMKKISKAVTDSLSDENTLGGGHNLLSLYKHFGPQGMFEQYNEQYKLKSLSYSVLKKELADSLNTFLKPIQEKQGYYTAHPATVEKILADGAKRARSIAQKNIKAVRKMVGLD